MSAQSAALTLRIGGKAVGRKDWVQPQEPYLRVRPVIQRTLALDQLDSAPQDAPKLDRVDDSAAFLPKVFVIVLAEDERRVDHFHKHIARRLPEAEQFKAFNARKDAVGTAEELHRLGVALSRSSVFWLGQRVEKASIGRRLGVDSTCGANRRYSEPDQRLGAHC